MTGPGPWQIGCWTVEVVDEKWGPSVEASPDPPGAFWAAVNKACAGTFPDLRASLERGVKALDSAVGVYPAVREPDEDDLAYYGHTWTDLTGLPPEEDSVVITVTYQRAPLCIPRRVLLTIVEEIERRRAAFVPPPPRHPLEPLDAETWNMVYGEEDWSFEAVRPWLDRLSDAGLLDPNASDQLIDTLEQAGLLNLIDLVGAVKQLAAYYRSPQRAAVVQPLDDPPIVGGPVSFQWFFERELVPKRFSHPWEWLAFAEYVLSTSTVHRGGGEELFAKVDGIGVHLWFRWEVERAPSLTHAVPWPPEK